MNKKNICPKCDKHFDEHWICAVCMCFGHENIQCSFDKSICKSCDKSLAAMGLRHCKIGNHIDDVSKFQLKKGNTRRRSCMKCVHDRYFNEHYETQSAYKKSYNSSYVKKKQYRYPEYNKKWRQDNKEKIREQKRRYRSNNREKYNAYARQYFDKYKHKINSVNKLRKARKFIRDIHDAAISATKCQQPADDTSVHKSKQS